MCNKRDGEDLSSLLGRHITGIDTADKQQRIHGMKLIQKFAIVKAFFAIIEACLFFKLNKND